MDFIGDAGMGWEDTAGAITEIATALPGYREEEAALYPVVVFCDDLNETIGLADQRVPLGVGPRNIETARQALKSCAPLAQGGWCVFIERVGGNLRFGVFRPTTLSFTVDPEDVINGADRESTRVIIVRALSKSSVELLGDEGGALQLDMSARGPQSITIPSAIKSIIPYIVSDLREEDREVTKRFLLASLTRSIQDCHGTLIAVISAGSKDRIFEGLWLADPIDVAKEVVDVERVMEQFGVARRQGTDYLIRGMIRSDGITVFSSDAKLVAFSCFIQLPEARNLDQGGARTRAFGALVSLVGTHLKAALRVSQDGGVSFRGTTE